MKISQNEKLQSLVEKANEQIQRLKDWYKEHKNAFDYMDLKLHVVSYYCYSKMEKEFPLCYASAGNKDSPNCYFDWFCEAEYDAMLEDLKENCGIDFNDYCFQLGRTSSFYLHDQSIFEFIRGKINWGCVMYNIMYELFSTDVYTNFKDEEGFIDPKKALEENELEWIATKMFDDVLKEYKNMLVVYDYIHNFKEKQVDAFKEWLQYYEDEFAEQKRQEEEYEAERQQLISEFSSSIIRDIVNKHINSNDDILLLLKEIENKEIDYED